MNRLRLTLALSVVLACAVGVNQAPASGPDASAAKKCKKGYKKNKKHKCVKKKFVPKFGTYKSKDGKTQLRVYETFLYSPTALAKKVRLVDLRQTPVTTLTCSNGQKVQRPAGPGGPYATVKGKSFKYADPAAPGYTISGKFTSTKSLEGKYTFTDSPSPGVTCASGAVKFKAKRTGR